MRDLSRARTDASQALARAKQQLGSFLLRNGIRYDGRTKLGAEAHELPPCEEARRSLPADRA